MTQLTNSPTSRTAVDKLARRILNKNPAVRPAEHLDVVNIDSTCWLAEKHLFINDIYKQICIGLAIYSPEELETIYRSLNNATTISDIFTIQTSLYNKHKSRSADEKSFINSWFNLNGSPQPGNDFAMPRLQVTCPTNLIQMISTFYSVSPHAPFFPREAKHDQD